MDIKIKSSLGSKVSNWNLSPITNYPQGRGLTIVLERYTMRK
jgi:hypothetical protein